MPDSRLPVYAYRAQVLRIIDADTYDVQVDVGFRMLAHLPLRLAHVDTAERFTVQGKRAKARVELLLGELPCACVVQTFKPADKYGRYLADLYVAGISVADVLLHDGLAVLYEGGTKASS